MKKVTYEHKSEKSLVAARGNFLPLQKIGSARKLYGG